ncbi:hypothetical protein [Paraflavitalea pollutisoli]|uniref:hypothetical protein n=1 Tax=Paraflavitalea pollutisoli TaxID=3034143 RepID=UPI0023EB2795|nr:hypothetical protein [Paraflavitalea sp. H1-2-19X]
MKYKLILLAFGILLSFMPNRVNAQKLDSLKNWRIHTPVDGDALSTHEDSLPFIASRLLSSDFKRELKSLGPIKTDSIVYVMTAYLLSYEDEKGKMVKVLACGAGHYIYIGRQRKFYGIPIENQGTWLEMLDDEYGKLINRE